MDIKLSFIIPEGCTKESECSEEMHRAFKACKQNLMNVTWIKPSQTLSLNELQKNHFVVFQKFEGECFEKVKDTHSVIVGPWCLLTCLTKGQPIPNVTWPIYNMAMENCYITCSHLPKAVKEHIKIKVQNMGGHYTDSIFHVNTHLVTDSVKSEKYIKAATSGIKIMLTNWVDEVWKTSLTSNVSCNDEKFDKYKCLPLQNLNISSTGFVIIDERNKLQRLIEENGGIYSGQMHISKTDILVCKGVNMSDKLKAAKKSKNVKCVTMEWIIDSIEKGYALPDTEYSVLRGTSTPTKQEEFINPNFSMISAIGNTTCLTTERSVLQETINMTNIPKEPQTKKRKSGSLDDLNEIVDRIDLKRVKRAGSFLDGCSIYLAGFGNEQREKICKILNFSGATRYEGISDRLTHIIVGDTSCPELNVVKSKGLQIHIVTVNWLHDCVEQEKVVPEEKYLVTISSNECGSPLSKKGLQLLRNKTSPVNTNTNPEQENIPADETDINTDIMRQYLKPSTSTQEDTLAQLLKDGTNPFDTKTNTKQINVTEQTESQPNESQTTRCSATVTQDDTTQLNQIFKNFKFIILNFDDEEEVELKDCIETLGGEVLSKFYKGIPDYALVPPFHTEIKHTAGEIVTDYWLTECWKENELREIEYYHRPFTVKRKDVLKDCVVTISGYTNTERSFLNNLVKELGGVFQEQFSRVSKNGILASSHLLSPVANGSKYAAAIKWGRPVVTKEWLFECAKLGKFVPEKKFLVGASEEPEETSYEINPEPTSSSNLTNIEKQYENRETELIANLEQIDKWKDQIEIADSTLTVNQTHTMPKNRNEKSIETHELNETPKSIRNLDYQSIGDTTPKNILTDNDCSPNVCSQVTPVNKIMNQVRSNYMLGTPPSTPPLPQRWGDVDTPETPLGAFIRPNPSPHLRKEMLKWINTFPETKSRRTSTPLSELKKRLWDKICPPKNSQLSQPDFNISATEDVNTSKELNTSEAARNEESSISKKESAPDTPENIMIQSKLLQLQEMLSSSGGNRKSTKKRESTVPVGGELKSSQACTVGWDYAECHTDTGKDKHIPFFMLSGVSMEEREELVKQLQSLGASVSELSNYDSAATHLISSRPSRNEKMLSSMAGGKWILHPDYIKRSLEIGKLADEEEFEYGNPKFSENVKIQMDRETEIRANAIHWWRIEITKRGYGAFHDMRAIVVSNKRDSIIRVIEAGGGMVIDAKPPFTEEIYATHCLLDPKFVSNMVDYVPLAEQGIYIFNTLYINDFLHRNLRDVKNCILPQFLKYYD